MACHASSATGGVSSTLRNRLAPYDVIRVALALLLLVAAGLKCHQLATAPALGTGFLDARWVLIIVVEYELFFGLWLLGNVAPRVTARVALVCFSLFAVVSLTKALSGATSCGCFGRLQVNPWYTFMVDVAAVGALLWWSPADEEGREMMPRREFLLRARRITLTWIFLGFPAAVAIGTYQPTWMADDGIIVGDGRLVVLEPEKWVGKQLPILPFIDDLPGRTSPGERPLREQLAEGQWRLLLYHHDCPKCREIMPRYEEAARRSLASPGEPRVAIIEIPPFGDVNELRFPPDVRCAIGRLDGDWDWFVSTPLEVSVDAGRILSVMR